jgi:hypothetical protein
MVECAAVKAGPGEKADTLVARRPAPDIVAETQLQRMQQSLGNRAIGRMAQARLIVGPAGDPYEREADRVADKVMACMPASCTPASMFPTTPTWGLLSRVGACAGVRMKR